jgi:hypothetical protein
VAARQALLDAAASAGLDFQNETLRRALSDVDAAAVQRLE